MKLNLIRLFTACFLLISVATFAQNSAIDKLYAQKKYEAAKQQLLPAYEEGAGLPTVAILEQGCADPVLLIKVLAAEYDVALKANPNDESLIKRAETIDQLAIYLLNSVALQEDKTKMLEELLVIYGQAQEICKNFYDQDQKDAYLDKAFYFAEQYKSMLLKDALREQDALSFGGVDEALRKEFQDLKLAIGELNKELLSEQTSYPLNEARVEELSKEVAAKSKELSGVYDQFEKDFAQYANLKNKQLNITTKMVQDKLLDDQSVFIEYSMGKDNYYIYVITKNNVQWEEIAAPKTVNEILAPFIKVMITPKEETLAEYLKKGHAVYQLLMAKVLAELPENINRLVIVPDGKLHNLPFEVLPYEGGEGVEDFVGVPYLLNKYVVSYSYAAALLKENRARKGDPSDLLLGVAADYNPEEKIEAGESRSGRTAQIRNALAPLPFAKEEVERLKAIFDGNFLFKEEANEAQFKKTAGDYTVIHLAMHGLANSENPELSGLAFTENLDQEEDNILYLHEINSLKLNAELVVLSACETGIGSFRAGEGVMSVARSFMYAGAPSVIMTLWPVNDQATQIIMEDFYALLQEGKPKDVALREAKLNYIKNVGDAKITAHPVLWGPYIQLGNDLPITIQKSEEVIKEEKAAEAKTNWMWIALIGGAVALLFIIVLVLRNRSKS